MSLSAATRHRCIPHAFALLLFGLHCKEAPAAADLSGVWMPDASLAAVWQPNPMPLTQKADAIHRQFDARRGDSARFCMPMGTPRNQLSTAAYPIEILQRDERITVVFDRLGDVRRIFIDGRRHPEEAVPNWMGHSIGRWHGNTLLVDTVAMTDQSILTDDGIPHSDAMKVSERFSLVKKSGEQLLQVDTQIEDPQAFTAPLQTRRYYRRAPEVTLSEGSASCLLDQWRQRLEQTNSELAAENKKLKSSASGSAP